MFIVYIVLGATPVFSNIVVAWDFAVVHLCHVARHCYAVFADVSLLYC